MSKSAKSNWHFDHVIQHATPEQMDRIVDVFIEAVEKEGLYCGGGFHPVGRCQACRQEDYSG